MAEAMQEIKAHLGPDALLLSTKEIHRKSGVWGCTSGFEVVAASDSADGIDVFCSSHESKHAQREIRCSESAEAAGLPSEGLAATYSPASCFNGRATATAKSTDIQTTASNPNQEDAIETPSVQELQFQDPISTGLYRDLVHRGVDARLAWELLSQALEQLKTEQPFTRTALLRAVTQATLSLIAAPDGPTGMPNKKIVAFVGPTGVGKTTSIAKLAARLALQQKKRVILITTDRYRIGAVDQLRIYAGLMGISFRFVNQVSELCKAIEESRQRDYILIDTAGRGPRDLEAMHELASYLKQSEAMERHLVVSAGTKPSDMRRIMDQFEICGPDHLLFTKLDETSTPGPILNELVRTQKSFSYYTDGQRVPDDFHVVPREQIMDIVLKQNEYVFKE